MDFRFQAADAVPPKGLALILWTVDGLTLKRLACSSAERPSVGRRGPWEFGRRCRYLSCIFANEAIGF
jgi:hypothetical protein